MDFIKKYSQNVLILIILFMVVLLLLFDSAYFVMINLIKDKMFLLTESGAEIAKLNEFQSFISLISEGLIHYLLPVSVVVVFMCGLLMWLFVKKSASKMLDEFTIVSKEKSSDKKQEKAEKPKEVVNKKEKEQHERQIFLHLLSVLQKEGRLIDFLAEDLSLYEDDQIGAAVRTIQEDCKKSINKYLAPKAVIDQQEGNLVVVETGFDPGAIKLTGNVTGEPPFKGALRHKGWRVTKFEMPGLSKTQDSNIIAPAEVEIE